ncbi:hypothetical protein M413DRAFT_442941 [Hebeloma cylindrosporum]|uniref:Transcription factor IIIC 90kDa subunit N-terminal domain-containing protein n=1 Tax=Hebeloma cylindrosporum TaxID=76867 RepID=A0A0C3CLH9_HEBCY|nr:hypothetical protein M413DRAFT_442941 [Hebeloma cylindrosporum h7]
MQKREPASVYGAIALPTATSIPSHRCLQWSADGQLCLVTKNAVVILTPDHGINFDADSALKSSSSSGGIPFGWFKTMIEHAAQIEAVKWPDYSQAWGAVSLGSLDLCLTSLAISPSGLSVNGRCIFATLSSNMDLIFWAAGKNYLKGEYTKVNEVTPFLLNLVAPTEEAKTNAVNVLKAQVVSIEWTPQAEFKLVPSPCLDGSCLVAGSRAGELIFLRYRPGSDPEHLTTLQVADTWITHIAFARWKGIDAEAGQPHEVQGRLAYSTSDGAIGLVKITQKLHEIKEETATFTPRYKVALQAEHVEEDIFAAAIPMGITALKWVGVGARHEPMLFASTPGMVRFWCRTNCTRAHTLRIPTRPLNRRNIPADASSLHPVSGVYYLEEQDRLVVVLFDGSIWVVGDLRWMWEESEHEKPYWVSTSMDDEESSTNGKAMQSLGLNSEALSTVSRTIFLSLENERREKEKGAAVDKWDMCRINGAVDYDGDGVISWVYESTRPSDFSYKQDSQHSGTVIVSKMWSDLAEKENLLHNLKRVLSCAKASSWKSPLHTLRAFFLHLRDPKRLEELHHGLLEVLRFQPDVGVIGVREGRAIDVPSRAISLVDEERMDVDAEVEEIGLSGVDERMNKMKENFRFSVSTHLFGWDELLSLRMRLSLADIAWKLSNNEQRQAECGVVAQALLNAISHRVLRTIIKHVGAVVGMLQANDVPFVSRLIVQSLLPGCPLDLVEEGKKLTTKIQPLLKEAKSASASSKTTDNAGGNVGEPLVPSEADIMTQLLELCPACGVEIPLEDITSAVCQHGHTWARCSVTTFILTTPWVRTCVGCSRKAFVPPSAHIRPDGQRDVDQIPAIIAQGGWVVEELLEAVKGCLFCGNRFVSIL